MFNILRKFLKREFENRKHGNHLFKPYPVVIFLLEYLGSVCLLVLKTVFVLENKENKENMFGF